MTRLRAASCAFVLALWISCCAVFASTSKSIIASSKSAQRGPSSDSVMRQHYDDAFRLQASGHTGEADLQHKLFLTEALHRVATGRANLGQYPQAVAAYEQALQIAPRDFALLVEYAEAALDADDPAKAKLLAEDALNAVPSTPEPRRATALHLLGQALWETGDRKRSIELYKDAASMSPTFENVYSVGTNCLSLGDKQNATRIFAEIEARFGDTASNLMQFGRAYILANYAPEAIEEYKKALTKDNRMPGLHYSLGAAYMQASGAAAYPAAEAEFHKELALRPNDTFVYPQLGRIALARHDFKAAESDLTRAEELDPDNSDTQLLFAQLYGETSRTQDQESAFRKAIAATADPSRHHYEIQRAHYQLGRLLIRSGKVAEGRKEMQISADLLTQSRQQDEANLSGKPIVQAPLQTTRSNTPAALADVARFEAQIGPAIASSYDNLGVHAAIGKDYAKAADYFGHAAEWNPASPGVDSNWGQAAFEAHRFTVAAGPLGRCLQSFPEDAAIRAMLGLSQYMVGDYADALQTLQPIEGHLDLLPQLPIAYAESLVKAGDPAQGMERLQTILRSDPGNAAAHRMLAEAYRKSGQLRDAEREDKLFGALAAQRTQSSDAAAANHSASQESNQP